MRKYVKIILSCVGFIIVCLAVWMILILNGYMPEDQYLHKSDWLQLFGTVIGALGTITLGIVTVLQTADRNRQDLLNRNSIHALPTNGGRILFSLKPQSIKDVERQKKSSASVYMIDKNAKSGNIVYLKIPTTFLDNIPSEVCVSHLVVAWDDNMEQNSCEFVSEDNKCLLSQSSALNNGSWDITICLDSNKNDFFNFLYSDSKAKYSLHLSVKFISNIVETESTYVVRIQKSGDEHNIISSLNISSTTKLIKS